VKADMAQRLAWQCHYAKLPTPICEYEFAKAKGRKWRFDVAFPDKGIAVEIEGVTYQRGSGFLGGRHVSVKGFKGDIEKYATAFALGWSILRVLPEHVTSGQALRWLEQRLGAITR